MCRWTQESKTTHRIIDISPIFHYICLTSVKQPAIQNVLLAITRNSLRYYKRLWMRLHMWPCPNWMRIAQRKSAIWKLNFRANLQSNSYLCHMLSLLHSLYGLICSISCNLFSWNVYQNSSDLARSWDWNWKTVPIKFQVRNHGWKTFLN